MDGKLQLKITPCAKNVSVMLFRLSNGVRASFRILNAHQVVKFESKCIDVSAQVPQEAAGEMIYACVAQYDAIRNAVRRQLRLLTKSPLKCKKFGTISL